MRAPIALMICMLVAYGCVNRAPDPEGDLSNIFRLHYYECPKCGSLDGGYYGKNSVSSWRSKTGTRCRHRWQEISKSDFDQRWLDRAGNTSHY